MDRKNITVSTIRDTLDDAGIDVVDDVIEEGTPQDEVMKVCRSDKDCMVYYSFLYNDEK